MKVPLSWLKDYIDINLTAQEIADRLTMAGHALDKPIYEQEGDLIMDLEDRGNRADTMGIIGIARELAALTEGETRYPKEANIPKVNNEKIKPQIRVETAKVIRWMAVVFKNVKVAPSPEKIQKRLKTYGIEVINNIVDITNYVMIETGMPLHAFDLKKIDEIVLRNARRGETLVTFEGTKLEFDEDDLVAADGKKPLTLTTAVGGKDSGISDSTTDVLIEAGLYHQPTARCSALKHNVRNETSARLGKYLHPHYCEVAIARAIKLMEEIVGASAEDVSFDYYPSKYEVSRAVLTKERLNLIAGTETDLSEAAGILESLEFTIKEQNESKLTLEIPYFRTDVTMEDDLVEEVLRIKGYDRLPAHLPLRPAPPKLVFPEMDLENRIRDIMVKIGFNEVVSSPIVDINDSRKTEVLNEERVVKLQNSWNEELNILRPEFISPQLKYVNSYIRHSISPIKIFEVGKCYQKEAGEGFDKYKEIRKIAFSSDRNFYALKSDLSRLFKELGVGEVYLEKIDFPAFKKGVAAKIVVGGEEVGEIGSLKKSVLDSFGIDRDFSHVNLHTSKLLKFAKKEIFPEVETSVAHYISEDFTFLIDEKEEVGKFKKRLVGEISPGDKIVFLGVYSDHQLKSKGKKSVTFNIKFATQDPEKAKQYSSKIKSLD